MLLLEMQIHDFTFKALVVSPKSSALPVDLLLHNPSTLEPAGEAPPVYCLLEFEDPVSLLDQLLNLPKWLLHFHCSKSFDNQLHPKLGTSCLIEPFL